jgi:hypothetical protein
MRPGGIIEEVDASVDTKEHVMKLAARMIAALALVALATPAFPCPEKTRTHTATNQTETPAAQPSGAVAKADKAEKGQKSEKAKRAQAQKAAATN